MPDVHTWPTRLVAFLDKDACVRVDPYLHIGADSLVDNLTGGRTFIASGKAAYWRGLAPSRCPFLSAAHGALPRSTRARHSLH